MTITHPTHPLDMPIEYTLADDHQPIPFGLTASAITAMEDHRG